MLAKYNIISRTSFVLSSTSVAVAQYRSGTRTASYACMTVLEQIQYACLKTDSMCDFGRDLEH